MVSVRKCGDHLGVGIISALGIISGAVQYIIFYHHRNSKLENKIISDSAWATCGFYTPECNIGPRITWSNCTMFASGGQTLCVITGASRGFGRAVALALARDFSDMGSEGQFVLVSRSEDGLEETKNQMKASFPSQKGTMYHVRFKKNKLT